LSAAENARLKEELILFCWRNIALQVQRRNLTILCSWIRAS